MRAYRQMWCWLFGLFWIAGQAALAKEPSAWPEFSPPKRGFSVRLPSAPIEHVDPSTGAITLQAGNEKASYMVAAGTLPQEALSATPQQILDHYKSEFLQTVSGSRLVSSENREIGGFPAMICVFEANHPDRFEAKAKVMFVLASPRIYSVGFISRKELFVEAEVDKYLATFIIK